MHYAESGVVRTKGELVAYSRWLCVTMGDATDADKAPVPRETDVHSVLEVAPVSMIARFEGARPRLYSPVDADLSFFYFEST